MTPLSIWQLRFRLWRLFFSREHQRFKVKVRLHPEVRYSPSVSIPPYWEYINVIRTFGGKVVKKSLGAVSTTSVSDALALAQEQAFEVLNAGDQPATRDVLMRHAQAQYKAKPRETDRSPAHVPSVCLDNGGGAHLACSCGWQTRSTGCHPFQATCTNCTLVKAEYEYHVRTGRSPYDVAV